MSNRSTPSYPDHPTTTEERMFQLRTEIHIDATPHAVWEVLTDAASFPSWNPFIHRMEGPLQEGKQLEVEVGSEGHGRMTFKPRVKRVEPGQELRWLGRLLVPGLFDGEHIFELEAVVGGTHLVHREEFRGILVPLFQGKLQRETGPGFEAMNLALKRRVEGVNGA